MKKVLVIVLVLAVVGLGVFSIHSYNEESQSRAAESAAKAEAQAAENRRQEADEALQEYQANQILGECKVALETYQNLTPAERTKTPAPDCDIEKLQLQ
jgi:hypothetical protein